VDEGRDWREKGKTNVLKMVVEESDRADLELYLCP